MTTRRSFGGGGYGGGGRMMTMGLPPFTTAVKWLIILNAAIFLGVLAPALAADVTTLFALIPAAVVHGWVWQLVTYSFLHAGVLHLLFNMLAVWMFGSQFEMDWGRRQFLEYFFFCAIGAALVTVAVAFTGALGMSPLVATVGASAGVYGLLIAFGMLYGEREILLFPLPFLIKAKYMVAVWIFLALVGTLQSAGGVNNLAHFAGLAFGFAYIKFLPRRGLTFLFSERYYGLRNSYYRWKRKRAARKFEVYMRKHDPSQSLDEYGNFRDPGAGKDKGNGESRGPWVN